MDYVRIWADEAGDSHLEEVTLDRQVAPAEPGVAELWVSAAISADGVQFVTVKEAGRSPDWHCAPRRQLVVFLDGWVRITTSIDGTYELPAGTVVLVEDTEGRGHITQHEPGDRAVILIPLDSSAASLGPRPPVSPGEDVGTGEDSPW